MKHETNSMKEIEKARNSLKESGYSDSVIDNYLNPKNLGRMEHYDGYGHIKSTCGDSMWMWLRIRDRRITDIRFISDICVGAVSAGSALTEMVKGKDIREALAIGRDDILRELGGLPDAFVHCAELAEDTLKAALRDYLRFAREPWKRAYESEHPHSTN